MSVNPCISDLVTSHGEICATRTPASGGLISAAGQTMQATKKSYQDELTNLTFRRQVLEKSISVVVKALAQIDSGMVTASGPSTIPSSASSISEDSIEFS